MPATSCHPNCAAFCAIIELRPPTTVVEAHEPSAPSTIPGIKGSHDFPFSSNVGSKYWGTYTSPGSRTAPSFDRSAASSWSYRPGRSGERSSQMSTASGMAA